MLEPHEPNRPPGIPELAAEPDGNNLWVMAQTMAHVGHWRYDIIARELYWSDELKRILGRPLEFRPTIEAARDVCDAAEEKRIAALLGQALFEGNAYAFDSRIRAADGSVRDIVSRGDVERDADGATIALVGIVQDVSVRKTAERERDRLVERIALATRAGKVGIWDLEIATNSVIWDENMFALYGIEPEAASLHRAWQDVLHPDDVVRVRAEYDAAVAGAVELDSEFRIIWPNEKIRTIRSLGTVIRTENGVATRIVGTNWDITEVRELAEQVRGEKEALTKSEARYRALTEAIPQLVWVVDSQGRIDYVNARTIDYTGYSREDLRILGRAHVVDPDGFSLVTRLRDRIPATEFECEVRLRRHDGTFRCHLIRSVPFEDRDGSGKWIVSASDIEDRKNSEARLVRAAAELAHLAHHDPLTNLPNRKLLMDRLAQAVTQASRDDRSVIILYLDLDRFKLVNDRFGHAAGDRVLAETGARLVLALRAGDTVSRVGGDEFVLVCAGRDTREDLALFARRLLQTVAEPIQTDDALVTIGASIGISRYPVDDADPDALVRKADAAMYAAKQSGRDTFRLYSKDMSESTVQTLALEAELQIAIAQRQFVVYYQPMISLQSGRLIGAEALVRWQHPQRGLLAPGDFIGFAEEQGMIGQIGDLVLREACAQIKRLELDSDTEFSLAVNVSAQQIEKPDFVQTLAAAIALHGIDMRRLEIEITESTVMGNTAVTVGVLRALKELGVKLSLDDFGTGYSSLSYIKNFPIDTLKIDRSFVRDIATDRTDQALAKTIITLAHSLGMRVVGEGVETPAQVEVLREFRSDCCQGYLISHPLPPTTFEAFYRTYEPLTV